MYCKPWKVRKSEISGSMNVRRGRGLPGLTSSVKRTTMVVSKPKSTLARAGTEWYPGSVEMTVNSALREIRASTETEDQRKSRELNMSPSSLKLSRTHENRIKKVDNQ